MEPSTIALIVWLLCIALPAIIVIVVVLANRSVKRETARINLRTSSAGYQALMSKTFGKK